MRDVALVVLSYLFGAVPFSFLVVRWRKGIDVRTIGSGNAGATNVLRAAGRGPAASALLLDVFKGVAAVSLARLLATAPWTVGACALAVVCGHVFPVFLRFRGGKGVATAAGALGVLSPLVFSVLLVVFVVTVATTRYVSLGSVLGALSFPPAFWLLAGGRGWLLASTALIAALITFKHLENLKRLVRGTESKLGGSAARGQPSP